MHILYLHMCINTHIFFYILLKACIPFEREKIKSLSCTSHGKSIEEFFSFIYFSFFYFFLSLRGATKTISRNLT